MEILTNEQMRTADRLTIASGVPSFELMKRAATAVMQHIESRFQTNRSVLIVCGPGNNGGDGYVVAKMLTEHGFAVTVHSITPLEKLSGDAATAMDFWNGKVSVGDPPTNLTADIVVDAMFGSGLRGEINGSAKNWIAAIANASEQSSCHVVAIDVPSGVQGDTGNFAGGDSAGTDSAGTAIHADSTVTFFRQRPAHRLLPGKMLCGELTVADIGIDPSVLNAMQIETYENVPELWLAQLPTLQADEHKYDRGHAVVFSGAAHATGAARLSAVAALRSGAGLVTVASPLDAIAANAAHLTAVMIAPIEDSKAAEKLLDQKRTTAAILGPANGVGPRTRSMVSVALQQNVACVLDADALTSFEDDSQQLFNAITANALSQRPVVLTPHDGEYDRLFGRSLTDSDRLTRARHASRISGAIVVLKGADTVIASPDGRAAINANAPPSLATAGSGDVLAGFIGGLLAQKMPAFEAACAAVWWHGQCANVFGPGLISEDLPNMLPAVLQDLAQR